MQLKNQTCMDFLHTTKYTNPKKSVRLTLGTARRACAHPKQFSTPCYFLAGRLRRPRPSAALCDANRSAGKASKVAHWKYNKDETY